jgi:hypothetical protein
MGLEEFISTDKEIQNRVKQAREIWQEQQNNNQ